MGTSFLSISDNILVVSVTKVVEKYSDSTSAFSLSMLAFCVLSSSFYRSPILAFFLVLDFTYFQNTFWLALEFLAISRSFCFAAFLVSLLIWLFNRRYSVSTCAYLPCDDVGPFFMLSMFSYSRCFLFIFVHNFLFIGKFSFVLLLLHKCLNSFLGTHSRITR